MSVRTIKMKSISTKPQPQPEVQELPEVKAPQIPTVDPQQMPSITSSTASRIMSAVGKTAQNEGTISHSGIKEHQELVLMLSRYGTSKRFGSYLKELNFNLSMSKLKKMSVPALQDTLIRVRTSVANKNSTSIWENSINSGIDITEKIVTATPLGNHIYLEGLGEALKEDETWLDLLEELQLEYQNLTYVSPQVRLTYCLLTVGAQVHFLNKIKHKIKNERVPIKKIQKTNDDEKKEKKLYTKKSVRFEDRILDLDEPEN